MSEWISMKIKLPPVEKEVLFLYGNNVYTGYYYSGFDGNDDGYYTSAVDVIMHSCETCEMEMADYVQGVPVFKNITHWKPAPPIQKEEGKG